MKAHKLTKAQQEVLDLVRRHPEIACKSLAIRRYELRPESAAMPFYRLSPARIIPLIRGTEKTVKALWLLGFIEPCGIGYDGQQYRETVR